MTELEKEEMLAEHKEQIDKYKEDDEDVRITQDPDLIKEAERKLTIISDNYKGFVIGIYRSPKVQKVLYIVLIAIMVAAEFHIYSVLEEYKFQVSQGIADWHGWEQKAREPERAAYSNRFIVVDEGQHTHNDAHISLEPGMTVSTISGSYTPVFEYYRSL